MNLSLLIKFKFHTYSIEELPPNLIDGVKDPLRLDVEAGADVLHAHGLFRAIVDLKG